MGKTDHAEKIETRKVNCFFEWDNKAAWVYCMIDLIKVHQKKRLKSYQAQF